MSNQSQPKGAIEMNNATGNFSIFKVNDDYIVAETREQAVAHYWEIDGILLTTEDEPDVEMIPHDRAGRFEREDGKGFDEMTFGEWLADFEYTEPQLLCWNE